MYSLEELTNVKGGEVDVKRTTEKSLILRRTQTRFRMLHTKDYGKIDCIT